MNTSPGNVIAIEAESVPLARQRRVLDYGQISQPHDFTVQFWADMVDDEELYARSKGKEGWHKVQSESLDSKTLRTPGNSLVDWVTAQARIIDSEAEQVAEPPQKAGQGPDLSTLNSQPSTSPEILDIATDRPPAAASPDPKDKGDIIGWCSYTASNGQCLVVVDFVSDPLLFKASKGVRGWMSVRTEPRAMDDEEKARQVRNLQHYILAKVVCGLEVLTGGNAA